MKSKKPKDCIIIVGILLGLLICFIGWFCWSIKNNPVLAEQDRIKYAALCDTISVITEKPTIYFDQFNTSELTDVRFCVIRDNIILQDTLVSPMTDTTNRYTSIAIPFDMFLKIDTILVEIGGNSSYIFELSGFNHSVYLHYGMFGYLGSHECRLSDACIVNGKRQTMAILRKEESIRRHKRTEAYTFSEK